MHFAESRGERLVVEGNVSTTVSYGLVEPCMYPVRATQTGPFFALFSRRRAIVIALRGAAAA